MTMKLSNEGYQLIKRWEGVRYVAYFDSAGVPTIGIGHTRGVTAQDVKDKRKITETEVRAYFDEDIMDAEIIVSNHTHVLLSQSQFDALVSFVFNLGGQNYLNSTLLSKLNRGLYEEVPFELNKWVKAYNPQTSRKETLRGLVSRRAAEGALFSRPAKMTPIPKDIRQVTPLPVRQERETLKGSRTIRGTDTALLGTAVSAGSTGLYAMGPVMEKASWMPHVIGGLIVIGIVLAVGGALYSRYARRDDFNTAHG